MEKDAALDRFEKNILRVLQDDGSLSNAAIAEKVGLSSSPCWRRIDRLEREGYIKKRVALVDRKKIGLNAQVFAQVLSPQVLYELYGNCLHVFYMNGK